MIDRDDQAWQLLIGSAIRRARGAAGLSQRELAERSGLSQPAISRIETETVNGLRYRTLVRVLAGLETLEVRLVVRRYGFAELLQRHDVDGYG